MSLVDVDWLAAHQHDPALRLCDVRWYLAATGRRGDAEYAKGHLPGAAFVDLDAWLAAPDDGTAGRHPLPSPDVLVKGLSRLGIGPDTHVVAYDDAGGAVAARLWWLLRAVGHARVSLLDGGLPAWVASGRPLTTDVPSIEPAALRTLRFEPSASLTLDELQPALRRDAVRLLDARPAERYRGDTEPVDPRPGHIPGAVSVPTASLLTSGRFLPADVLRARFAEAGVDGTRPVVASCGSGVTACLLLFALDHTGLAPFGTARLYAGSYSEWSRRTALPIAVGAAPGALP